MGFLLTRRWVLFGLAVIVLALACVWLGKWQFSRLQEREQRNAWFRANLAASPAPVEDVLSPNRPLPADAEWTTVRVTGRYDADATVVLRYQTRNGAPGVDLLTPLITGDGIGVVIDRGWIATQNTGEVPNRLPQPPAGNITVVGWARADATGDSTTVTDGSTRLVSSRSIARTVDYRLYAGFVDAKSEDPSPAVRLVGAELPDLGDGPHFFYGLQWWFFAALAVFGFGYLVWDERRRILGTAAPESRGERQPVPMDDAFHP